MDFDENGPLPVLEWDTLVGPGVIPCEQQCVVPPEVELIAFPETRHAWAGIFNCPNGCGRSFEIKEST